jgi:hypothetical protein
MDASKKNRYCVAVEFFLIEIINLMPTFSWAFYFAQKDIEMKEKILSVDEKLDLIEKSGWKIAYDGCHKLYFLQNEAQLESAQSYDYEIHSSSELKQLWENSCPLRFVTKWGLDGNGSFAHEWNIEQFEEEMQDEK